MERWSALSGSLRACSSQAARVASDQIVLDRSVEDPLQQPVGLGDRRVADTALPQRRVPRPDRRAADPVEVNRTERRQDVQPQQAAVEVDRPRPQVLRALDEPLFDVRLQRHRARRRVDPRTPDLVEIHLCEEALGVGAIVVGLRRRVQPAVAASVARLPATRRQLSDCTEQASPSHGRSLATNRATTGHQTEPKPQRCVCGDGACHYRKWHGGHFAG